MSAARRPRLLLVDDEVHVLSALRRSLRREGIEILAEERPERALERLAMEPVDAILSDHKMPGMTGLELFERAARIRPRATRLLLTGWPEEIPPERARALGIRAVLPKPWDDAELKEVLRTALASRP